MRKVVQRLKQTISVLLAVVMVATAAPSMSLEAYAKEADGKAASQTTEASTTEADAFYETENVNGTEEPTVLPETAVASTEAPAETETPEATTAPEAATNAPTEVTPEATTSPSTEATPEITPEATPAGTMSPTAEITPEVTASPSATTTPEAATSPSPETSPEATVSPSATPTASPIDSLSTELAADSESKTQVSVKISSTDVGYTCATLNAEITNPDKETINDIYFKITGANTQQNEQGFWAYVNGSRSDTLYYNYYCFAVDDTVEVTPFVYVGEGSNLTTVEGEPVTITCRPAEELAALLEAGTFEATANTASVTVDYHFDLKDPDDTDGHLYLFCESSDGISSASIYSSKGIYNGSTSFSLTPDTEYNLTFKIANDYQKSRVIFEKQVTLKTKSEVTYTEEDIPDAVLRAAIQARLWNDKTLTSTNLEKITYLSVYNSTLESLGVDSSIKDLKGLELLTNLTSLTLNDQDFSDISSIAKLTNLISLNLNNNNINAIPDLSGLNKLTWIYLPQNKIPRSEFTDAKMPASLLTSQPTWKNYSTNQRKEEAILMASAYPMTGGQALLYVEIEGARYDSRDWTVSAIIDGNTYDLAKNSDSYSVMGYSALIPITEGTYQVTFRAQESYNGKSLETTGEAQLTDTNSYIDYQRYLAPDSTSLSYGVSLALQEGESPVSAKLVSAEDSARTVGISRSTPYVSSSGSRPGFWSSVFESYPSEIGDLWKYVYGSVTLSSLTLKGNYNLVITTNMNEYVFENYAVSNYTNPYIRNIYYNNEYDNAGEYYYVTVSGEALNYDGFYPVLSLPDGTVITELSSQIGNTFKLKKLSEFSEKINANVSYVTKEGYSEVKWSNDADHLYTYTGDNIVTIVYNAKEKKYLLYASSSLPTGTKLSIGINKDDYPSFDYTNKVYEFSNKVASATVSVTGSETEINFLDAAGTFYELTRVSAYNHYFGAVWTIDGNITNEDDLVTYQESGFGNNSSDTGEENRLSFIKPELCYRVGNEIPIEVVIYNNTVWTSQDTLTATLQKTDSDTVLSEQILTPEIQDTTVTFEGSFPANAALTEGKYTVTITNTAHEVSEEEEISLLRNDTFFQRSQYCSTISSNNTSYAFIQVTTIDAENLDLNKFKLSFYDINFNPITDVKLLQTTSSIYETGYDYIRFTCDGLLGKYGYVYCRVTYDGELGLDIDAPSLTYYAAHGYDPAYGSLLSIPSGAYFSYATGRGYAFVFSNYYDNYTVEIRNNRTGELVGSFQVNTRGSHIFTQNDLKAVLAQDPDLKQLYHLIAKKDGRTLATQRNVNIGYYENTVVPTSVTLSPATAVMQKGDVLQLAASLKPTNAGTSLTYSSSKEEVATVSSSGKVTALNAGTAKITVTTANGKTAACSITVTDYRLSESSLTLNAGDDTKELSVYNGDTLVTKNITWSSSDPSVASVTAGKITAKKRGTTTITAQIADIQLTCEVTVTSEILTLALLSEKDRLETGGDQDTLHILCTPATEADPASFLWSTSDETIATVADGIVTTGEKAGEVTISVTTTSSDTGTVLTASKVYTVTAKDTVTELEDEVILYAVANTDMTLQDLASQLPDGWQWVNSETKLAAFADQKEKDFAIVHKNETTGAEYRDTVTVRFTTIDDIELLIEDETASKLLAGQTVNASLVYSVVGTEDNPRLPDISYSVSFAPKAKTDVVAATVTNPEEGTVALTGLKAGTTTLSLTLYSGNTKIYTGTQKLTVVTDKKGNGIADIDYALQYQTADGTYTDLTPGEDGSYTVKKENGPIYLINKSLNDDKETVKVTCKTSDSSIIKVGKAAKAEPDKLPLTLAKGGTAVISIIADDTLKTTKTATIKVISEEIFADQTSLVINRAAENPGATISVYNNFNAVLTDAACNNSSVLVKSVEENGTIEIGIAESAAKTNKANLTVTLTDSEQMTHVKVIPITVKVETKAPAVTIKQVDKLHTLYKDRTASFSIGAAGMTVEEVKINGATTDYDPASGMVNYDGTATKLTFTVKVKDYQSVAKTVTVKTEKPKLKLSATSGTVYTDSGCMTLSFRIMDQETGTAIDLSNTSIETGNESYQVTTDGDKVLLTALTAPGKKGDKLTLKVTNDSWKSAQSFTYTVKPAELKKASLLPGSKSLTLYVYEGKVSSVSTPLTLKGGTEASELLSGLDITETVNKKLGASLNKTLKVAYENGSLQVTQNAAMDEMKEGTYSFKLTLSGDAFSKPISTTLKVKVVKATGKNALKATLKASGSIDVLNRGGTSVTLTPKFTGMAANAKVTGMTLTGEDSHLFEIKSQTGSKAVIQLKQDKNVITRYAYKVAVTYTIETGDTTLTVTSAPVSIKLSQKSAKVKATGGTVFSNTTKETKQLSFAIANSAGAAIEADRIELLNCTGDFDYDQENGTLIHTVNGETATGKSYTLKFAVYPKGCGTNEKPVTVTCKVKIQKS